MADDEQQEGQGPDAEPTEPTADADEAREELTDEAPSEAPDEEAPDEEGPGEEGPGGDDAPGPAEPVDPGAAEDAPPAEEAAPAEAPAAEEVPAAAEEVPAAEETPAAEEAPAAEGGDEAPAAEEARPAQKRRGKGDEEPKEEVIPGAHLEPDLVLDEPTAADADSEFAAYADGDGDASEGAGDEGDEAPAPVAPTALDLAADARYGSTGKRKTAVARVILRPGGGSYTVNGRPLDVYFPRPRLQRVVRAPLETIGYESKMDVVAKIHGGGVAAQADALRHGVARALVEAEPSLRTELKRRGFLTRDPRVKERKKAGLKKARKRPQFSKR